jgi:two-component system CheB/CheR fusion protein
MDNSNVEFRRQLRGLFAVLRAMVRRSSAGEGSREDYAALLEERIGALARVQDMLMRAPSEGVDLAELVHGELLAQTIPASRYGVAGPDTRIGPDAAIPVALAVHELTMNSLLHGALGALQGNVDVSWDYLDKAGSPWLKFDWQETGGQLSGLPPTVKGFGLELIERTLPYELGACTATVWPVSGVRIEIQIPVGSRVQFWRPADQAIAV